MFTPTQELFRLGVGLNFRSDIFRLDAYYSGQCLSQDLETGCLKLAVIKFWGV